MRLKAKLDRANSNNNTRALLPTSRRSSSDLETALADLTCVKVQDDDFQSA